MTRNGNEDSTVTTMEDNDNAVPVKSRILIQSDWNEGGASWLMVKTPGETSLRGAFDDAAATPEKDAADGFSATKLRNTLVSNVWSPMPYCDMLVSACLRVHLRPTAGITSLSLLPQVRVSHPRAGYAALFLAPSCVWPRIHEKGGVSSLDVTEGGLGVSASSAGDLHVWTTNNGEVRRRLEGRSMFLCISLTD